MLIFNYKDKFEINIYPTFDFWVFKTEKYNFYRLGFVLIYKNNVI